MEQYGAEYFYWNWPQGKGNARFTPSLIVKADQTFDGLGTKIAALSPVLSDAL